MFTFFVSQDVECHHIQMHPLSVLYIHVHVAAISIYIKHSWANEERTHSLVETQKKRGTKKYNKLLNELCPCKASTAARWRCDNNKKNGKRQPHTEKREYVLERDITFIVLKSRGASKWNKSRSNTLHELDFQFIELLPFVHLLAGFSLCCALVLHLNCISNRHAFFFHVRLDTFDGISFPTRNRCDASDNIAQEIATETIAAAALALR